MRFPIARGFVFAPIAAAIIEGVAKFDVGAYAFALLVAYPITAVLGIPGCLLLRRGRMVGLWQLIVLGCVLGTLSGLLVTSGSHGGSFRAVRVMLCGLEGAMTAVAFWLISLCPPRLSARIQIGLVVFSLIGLTGHLVWWMYLAGSLAWTPAVILCAVTVVAVLVRPAIARLLIYLLAALYAGYWLVLSVPGLIAGIRAAKPWQLSALSLVPGIGLVLLPAAYCCHVATTYMPRRSGMRT